MFWFDNNLEREQQWQHFRSINGTKQVIAVLYLNIMTCSIYFVTTITPNNMKI